MQKTQRCKASARARENMQYVDQKTVAEPDDEPQLRSSTDRRLSQPDQQAASAAPSNSNSESVSATQLPPHDTQDSDRGAHRSRPGPAEIRSRPHITKAPV